MQGLGPCDVSQGTMSSTLASSNSKSAMSTAGYDRSHEIAPARSPNEALLTNLDIGSLNARG